MLANGSPGVAPIARRLSPALPLIFGLAAALAAAAGYGYYQSGVSSFIARKSEEKQTVLQLVGAFVSTYAANRVSVEGVDMPVPATFRAHALQAFNQTRDRATTLNVEMPGVPGLVIATQPAEASIAATIEAMAKGSVPDNWSGIADAKGEPVFRTIRAVRATTEACVTCHNRIQAGLKTWKLGDVMGAFVLDAGIASFLSRLRIETAVLSLFVFMIAMAGSLGFYARLAEQRNKLRKEGERSQILAEARSQAQAEARELSQKLIASNEELTAANASLESNLGELRRTQDELVQKNRLAQLGEVTATVAHELRNPLGAVKTSAYVIERRLKTSDPELTRPMERINQGIKRCDAVISQLLDFARSSAIKQETLNFDNWLEERLQEHAQALPGTAAVECTLGMPGVHCRFDKNRFERVLTNLLGNAAEAMAGMDSKARAGRALRVAIATSLTARGAELSVADNGPGMAPDVLARAFEPLFTTKNFGTGLGLSSIQQIAKQHGGGVEITSTVGHGTCVTVWLPPSAIEIRKAA